MNRRERRYTAFARWAFRAFWCQLARRSRCDSWRSMECRRVYREWKAAGRPLLIGAFIRARANAIPRQPPPEFPPYES